MAQTVSYMAGKRPCSALVLDYKQIVRKELDYTPGSHSRHRKCLDIHHLYAPLFVIPRISKGNWAVRRNCEEKFQDQGKSRQDRGEILADHQIARCSSTVFNKQQPHGTHLKHSMIGKLLVSTVF